MKATGIVRKVDELGRLVLPIELRRVLGIEIGTALEIYFSESQMLKKYHGSSACYFCGRVDGKLLYFKSILICDSCQTELLNPFKEAAAASEAPSDPEVSNNKQTKRTGMHGERAKQLEELLAQYPNPKQHELAKMLNFSQGYVSLLLKNKPNASG